MNRYFAILIALFVFSVPQFASAASVSFGAGLNNDGGHAGGSASDSGPLTTLTGKMHWSGTAVDFDNGWIIFGVAILEGKVTRTNDPSLEGKHVRVTCNAGAETVSITVIETAQGFDGKGHVTIK